MTYVEYIQNGLSSEGRGYDYKIDTGYYPNENTKVRIKFSMEEADGEILFGSTMPGNFWRIFAYESTTIVFDFPNDSDYRTLLPYTMGTVGEYEFGNNYITNLATSTTQINTTVGSFSGQETLKVWGDKSVMYGSKIYYIEIYEGNTLIMDLRPCLDDYDVPCLYDEVGEDYYYNSNQGSLIAGPVLSSIIINPASAIIPSVGNTISVSVTTENYWTAAATDGTWLTLSANSGQGDGTITVTVDPNAASTSRTDTITFVDTNTSDEAVLTIRQKKYQTGQPLYIGGDEVPQLAVGEDEIIEAYIGDELVFSSGPFVGIRVNPNSLTFIAGTLVQTIDIKSSESWTMTVPAWITASALSGVSGDTTITLTATAQSAATSGTVSVVSANYSATVAVSFATYVVVPNGIRSSSAPLWTLSEYIDTGIYVTGDPTVRIKYIGAGVFSDRIVGFDATECGSDAEDFRYFPTMADAGESRLEIPSSLYDDGIGQDITFGDIYVFDNINENMVAEGYPSGSIDGSTTIRVDMSVNWIQQVTIEMDGVTVFDGVSARLGNNYGLWDSVSSSLFTSNNCTVIGNESNGNE